MEKVLKLSGLLIGRKFIIDENNLNIKGGGIDTIVPKNKIETITSDFNPIGVKIKIIGNGTELASTVVKKKYALKTINWLNDNLGLKVQ